MTQHMHGCPFWYEVWCRQSHVGLNSTKILLLTRVPQKTPSASSIKMQQAHSIAKKSCVLSFVGTIEDGKEWSYKTAMLAAGLRPAIVSYGQSGNHFTGVPASPCCRGVPGGLL